MPMSNKFLKCKEKISLYLENYKKSQDLETPESTVLLQAIDKNYRSLLADEKVEIRKFLNDKIEDVKKADIFYYHKLAVYLPTALMILFPLVDALLGNAGTLRTPILGVVGRHIGFFASRPRQYLQASVSAPNDLKPILAITKIAETLGIAAKGSYKGVDEDLKKATEAMQSRKRA